MRFTKILRFIYYDQLLIFVEHSRKYHAILQAYVRGQVYPGGEPGVISTGSDPAMWAAYFRHAVEGHILSLPTKTAHPF